MMSSHDGGGCRRVYPRNIDVESGTECLSHESTKVVASRAMAI